MSQFLYFVGRGSADIPRLLAEAGLTERLAGSPGRARMTGPGGQEGLCLAWGDEAIAYEPERQVWTGPYAGGVDGGGELYIGYWRDRCPGPADLRRKDVLDGHEVVMGDGQAWLVPCWRLAPQWVTLSPTRELRYEPLPVRRLLERHKDRFVGLFAAAQPEAAAPGTVAMNVDDAEMLASAAEVLSVNYRIGPDPAQELSILKLITPPVFSELMAAVLDLPFLKELAQKKTQGCGP